MKKIFAKTAVFAIAGALLLIDFFRKKKKKEEAQ